MHEFLSFWIQDVLGGMIFLIMPPLTQQDIKFATILGILFLIALAIKKILN